MREKFLYGLLALTGAACIGWAFFGSSGVREVARLKEEKARLQEQVRELTDKKEILARQAEQMRTDPRLIERRARDTLGMVRPDETVIMTRRKKPDAD